METHPPRCKTTHSERKCRAIIALRRLEYTLCSLFSWRLKYVLLGHSDMKDLQQTCHSTLKYGNKIRKAARRLETPQVCLLIALEFNLKIILQFSYSSFTPELSFVVSFLFVSFSFLFGRGMSSTRSDTILAFCK